MSRTVKFLSVMVLIMSTGTGCGLFGHCPEDYECYYSPNADKKPRSAKTPPDSRATVSNPADER